MNRNFIVDKNEIKIKIDPINETISVNNLLFSSLEDYIYFVNKLTDIAEEMKEGKDEI